MIRSVDAFERRFFPQAYAERNRCELENDPEAYGKAIAEELLRGLVVDRVREVMRCKAEAAALDAELEWIQREERESRHA